ncbi:uncharacterized protein MONOS_5781 [Monocercomonoides exilis]|uniref:uncharacterized protein n=1 Tax=Monocercomonoides exilis TaxID=2049356 RepID=UPI00355AC5F5|nr:hypothetical protein MONOS_5781 [Monocercomonoides exilis]|eukprot:MONOS_5781.1-p1 / transcript=MONOS_5781.1 / gene=MONOS_5781 / organism=Monocercomonoides_exilis_PA203 / gene_product=unspecified product / transcript_product=unspecified product / location=Mono_scaffold00173:24563-25906(-) / protein_length=360 / sequence_SO=supercontig / SO=protein_coding / is_pseudo=false
MTVFSGFTPNLLPIQESELTFTFVLHKKRAKLIKALPSYTIIDERNASLSQVGVISPAHRVILKQTMKKELLEQKDFIEAELAELDPSRNKKKAEEPKGDESGAENMEDTEEDRNPKGRILEESEEECDKEEKDDDYEGEDDGEAIQSEENKYEDLSKSKSKSKYVPFLFSSCLDQSFLERDYFCEQPSTTEKERTKERNKDFSFSTLSLSLFPSGYRTLRAVVTQRPLFLGNRLANLIEAVPLTLKFERVRVKMDASLEEQIRTKVNYIRPAENEIDNYDQSVTILSRTLHVFVHNTHKMLSEKPLSILLVKGKASSMQSKDGKKINVVNFFPSSKAKKTSFVRFCCPHQLLTLIFKV